MTRLIKINTQLLERENLEKLLVAAGFPPNKLSYVNYVEDSLTPIKNAREGDVNTRITLKIDEPLASQLGLDFKELSYRRVLPIPTQLINGVLKYKDNVLNKEVELEVDEIVIDLFKKIGIDISDCLITKEGERYLAVGENVITVTSPDNSLTRYGAASCFVFRYIDITGIASTTFMYNPFESFGETNYTTRITNVKDETKELHYPLVNIDKVATTSQLLENIFLSLYPKDFEKYKDTIELNLTNFIRNTKRTIYAIDGKKKDSLYFLGGGSVVGHISYNISYYPDMCLHLLEEVRQDRFLSGEYKILFLVNDLYKLWMLSNRDKINQNKFTNENRFVRLDEYNRVNVLLVNDENETFEEFKERALVHFKEVFGDKAHLFNFTDKLDSPDGVYEVRVTAKEEIAEFFFGYIDFASIYRPINSHFYWINNMANTDGVTWIGWPGLKNQTPHSGHTTNGLNQPWHDYLNNKFTGNSAPNFCSHDDCTDSDGTWQGDNYQDNGNNNSGNTTNNDSGNNTNNNNTPEPTPTPDDNGDGDDGDG